MATRRGRTTRARRGGGRRRQVGSKAGFLRSARWAADKVNWHENPGLHEKLHNELLAQQKAGKIPVSKRGPRVWAGQTIRGGDSRRAILNPNHPLHVFEVNRKKMIFGANTPGVIFNTKGTLAPVDFRKLARVMAEAIMAIDSAGTTRRDS